MFSGNWGSAAGAPQQGGGGGRKRGRTLEEHIEHDIRDAHPEGEAVQFISDIKHTIEKELHKPPSSACLAELCIDHVLSRLPYRSILENLFGDMPNSQIPDIPVISRVYEEKFMRQPMGQEAPCAMGSMCECMFIDRSQAFVGVEFRLQNDPPGSPQMCVLCSRKTTQKLFYDMCYTGHAPKCVIQRYGNIFGQAGNPIETRKNSTNPLTTRRILPGLHACLSQRHWAQEHASSHHVPPEE